MDKGAYGEYLTRYVFDSSNFKGYFKILSNLYVPYKNGTVEIDLVVIHERGIFVLESKNYSGWIYGDAEQVDWIQILNQKTKKTFYNPIKQNRTHVELMSKYLGIDKSIVKSYIVFSQRCELKEIPKNTREYTITKRDKLLSLINMEMNGKNFWLTKKQVDEIYSKLSDLTNVSQKVKEKHIKDIKRKYKN